MNYRTILSVLLWMGLAASQLESAQPNILFILADDLAWSDLGCYGHRWHETPHLDALANEGMRFSDGYASAPICSASRASILTGKTVARLNFEFVVKSEPGLQVLDSSTPLQAPHFTLNLPLQESTIAECLHSCGYETAFFGKWHLSPHHERYLGWSPTHGPEQQGFQVATQDFGSHPYAWGKKPPESIDTPGEFPIDSMVNHVKEYLTRSHASPFFVMASSFYVHTPIRTPCRWLLQKYEGRVPHDSQNREQRIRYAAFVETFDHHVGQMLQALDQSGARANTLVVFTSDNGGHPEYAANGPLRGSKWNLYEGGIRVPLIARLPGTIASDSTSATPVIGYDLLPTFVAFAGGKATDIDGIDLTPVFKDANWHSKRDLIWHFPYYHPETGYVAASETIGVDDFQVSKTRPQSAIRRGEKKLLQFYESDKVELYDVHEDVGEQHDQSDKQPAFANELKSTLHQTLNEMKSRFAVIRPSSKPSAVPGQDEPTQQPRL